MSHFYGMVKGGQGPGTRCGTKKSGIKTTAASYSGAVEVRVRYDEESGEDIASIYLIPWRGRGTQRHLFTGPISGSPLTGCLDPIEIDMDDEPRYKGGPKPDPSEHGELI